MEEQPRDSSLHFLILKAGFLNSFNVNSWPIFIPWFLVSWLWQFFFLFLLVKPSSFLFLGCAVLQGSPVAGTPTYCDVLKEACKCDFDDFVIVGKIWKLTSDDSYFPSPHMHIAMHHMRYRVGMAFKETSPKIRVCPWFKKIIRCFYFKCLDNQSLISLVELNAKADTHYSVRSVWPLS